MIKLRGLGERVHIFREPSYTTHLMDGNQEAKVKMCRGGVRFGPVPRIGEKIELFWMNGENYFSHYLTVESINGANLPTIVAAQIEEFVHCDSGRYADSVRGLKRFETVHFGPHPNISIRKGFKLPFTHLGETLGHYLLQGHTHKVVPRDPRRKGVYFGTGEVPRIEATLPREASIKLEMMGCLEVAKARASEVLYPLVGLPIVIADPE